MGLAGNALVYSEPVVKEKEPEHPAGSSSSSGSTGSQPPPVVINKPPPPAVLKCHVPKLKGKTLAQAKKQLAKAHCKLGKIAKPKHPTKHKEVIVTQKPNAGKTLPAGSKIAVRLG
ncbi:MAG: PASTA domain-containing protein [Candidatus Saccharimonadales bacterium]